MTYIFVLMRPAGILLCCIIMPIGCTDQDTSSDLHVLHYNQHNNITSLDPAYAKSQNNIWAVNHIYSTLLDLDDSLRIVPGLAHTWESSEDGRRHTFHLRSDVLFHDDPCFKDDSDRTLTAEDVKYSYERLMDTTLNAPGSWVFAGKVADERPFEVVNDTTLVIRFSRPFAPFLSLLTMQYCSIVPKEAVEYYGGDFFKQPVGSGPFQFKRWISNQGLFLTRYEDYHGWKDSTYASNLDGVRTSFIGERSLAFLELVNGQIDFFTGLESSYINTALTPTGDLRERYADRIQFVKMPYLNFEYLGMNPGAPGAHPLLAETDFRKALNYGIDRQLMLTSLRSGIGRPADAGVITRGLPAYDPKRVVGYEYDPEKASELLAQWDADLLRQPLKIFTSKDYLDLTTFIARQWEDLGLTIELEVVESAILRNRMRSGELPLFRASWIADYPDGESFLSMFYGDHPAPPNYTRFQDERFDELYDLAMATSDVDEKVELYQQMDQLLVGEAPVVFLFYDEASIFASRRVEGLSRNGLNLLQVRGVNVRDE